jgi:hypothetical protein
LPAGSSIIEWIAAPERAAWGTEPAAAACERHPHIADGHDPQQLC